MRVALLRTQADERLVALARAGDERAFEAIVERHRGALLRHGRRLLADASAEDAVQQTFLAAWTALCRGDDVRDLGAWLHRILHNTALNVVRGAAREMPAELGDSVPGGAPAEDVLERRMALRRTLADVAALPERQREALLRTAVEGRSQEEVARSLGLSHGAVAQLVMRGRRTLRAAATALTPGWLVDWATTAGSTPSAVRLAEIAGGGASALTVGKVVAVVAVAGTAATGAVVAEHAHERPAPVAAAQADAPANQSRQTPTPAPAAAPSSRGTAPVAAGGEGPGPGRRGSREVDERGPKGSGGSGSGRSGMAEREGSGSRSSGTDSGSGGSDDPASSGSGSSGSGGSGSSGPDDPATSGSGSGGSGSGGSGDSGSSGPGSSGVRVEWIGIESDRAGPGPAARDRAATDRAAAGRAARAPTWRPRRSPRRPSRRRRSRRAGPAPADRAQAGRARVVRARTTTTDPPLTGLESGLRTELDRASASAPDTRVASGARG